MAKFEIFSANDVAGYISGPSVTANDEPHLDSPGGIYRLSPGVTLSFVLTTVWTSSNMHGDQLLNRRTATWSLLVLLKKRIKMFMTRRLASVI